MVRQRPGRSRPWPPCTRRARRAGSMAPPDALEPTDIALPSARAGYRRLCRNCPTAPVHRRARPSTIAPRVGCSRVGAAAIGRFARIEVIGRSEVEIAVRERPGSEQRAISSCEPGMRVARRGTCGSASHHQRDLLALQKIIGVQKVRLVSRRKRKRSPSQDAREIDQVIISTSTLWCIARINSVIYATTSPVGRNTWLFTGTRPKGFAIALSALSIGATERGSCSR